LKCAPTTEELNQIHGYDGEEDMLANTEKFFKAIGAVPRVTVCLCY
jgi:hypothetical protein